MPVYLDNSTITKPSDTALNQMMPFLRRHWKDPFCPYALEMEPMISINQSIEEICELIGADDKETFIFTSSASVGIAQMLDSIYFQHIYESGKNHLLTTQIEDSAVLMNLQKLSACELFQMPLNENGQLTREILQEYISPRTALLSLSWASGLTGVMHPIWDIANFCEENDILLHVDVSHVLGKIFFRLQDLPIDFLTFDGDLIHAPRGCSALFINQNKFRSFQEKLDPASLVALGIAAKEVVQHFDHQCTEVVRLRNQFEQSICSQLPEAKVLFPHIERLPNVSAISFPTISSELLLYHLTEKGVHATMGGGRLQKLEHVLTNTHLDLMLAKCALSFSLSREITEEEIQLAVGIIVDAVKQCAPLSTQLVL